MRPDLPDHMQIIEISRPGGPEVLNVSTRPLPHIKSGEVLIRVEAAGVNRPDCFQRSGGYPAAAGPFGPARTRSRRDRGRVRAGCEPMEAGGPGLRVDARRRLRPVLRGPRRSLPATAPGMDAH